MQVGSFTHAQLVQYLARLLIAVAIMLGALILREDAQRTFGKFRLKGKRLKRGDAAITPKERDIPGNASRNVDMIVVGGAEQAQIIQRTLQRPVEERIARLDGRVLRHDVIERFVFLRAGLRRLFLVLLLLLLVRVVVVLLRRFVFQVQSDLDLLRLSRLQIELVAGFSGVQAIGFGIEGNDGLAVMLVRAVIRQHNFVALILWMMQCSPLDWPFDEAAQHQHVGKVAIERQADLDRRR